MTIQNASANETVTFKIWDASACQLLDATSSFPVNTNPGATIGQNNPLTINAMPVPLAVAFLSFSAEVTAEEEVHLQWRTTNEIDHLGFEIERKSITGTWMKLGFIENKETNQPEIEYVFTDKNPEKNNYYRLKQIDMDGTFSYSPIKLVELEKILVSKIEVSPNPFRNAIQLNVISSSEQALKVDIFNANGQKIKQVFIDKPLKNHHLQIDMTAFAQGVYYAYIKLNEALFYKKIVKI